MNGLPDGSDSVISTQGLTRYFGHRKVVDAVNLSVPRGSVFAFLGRNGSGKTTTIRMLLGLLAPTRGSSAVLGFDSQHLPPEVRARIGYMSESHTLYNWMTVRQCGEYQSKFYLMMLALIEWPALESCPACRKRRVVTRERCEHCDQPFPAPARDGTEIFEQMP